MRNISLCILLVLLMCTSHAQWTRIEAVPPFDVPSLRAEGASLFAGTDSAVYSTNNNGQTWARSTTLPSAPLFVDGIFQNMGVLYAGTGGAGIYTLQEGGTDWQSLSTGLTGLGSAFVKDFAMRGGDVYCATGGGGVFRRVGDEWQAFGGLANMNAGNTEVVKSFGDTLWVGAGGNGFIWRSLPGSSAFEAFQVAPLQGEAHQISDIIRRGDALLIGGTYGVFRSDNGGTDWTWSSTGLPGSGIVRFVDAGPTLYALRSTAASGLYRSLDNGHTWELQETMPYCYSMALYGDRLYAARFDGLWVREVTDVGHPEHGAGETVVIWPNPAEDEVMLERSMKRTSAYRLLDPLGRCVQEGVITGQRTIIRLERFARGVYLLQVQETGRWSEHRLMLR